MKKIIAILITLLLLFSSNNYEELNNIAIITNIGIEVKENTYHITFQELIPKKEENKITKTYEYYTNKNNTLKNTFKSIEEDMTKRIYLDHLENIIIKSDHDDILKELIDYFPNEFDHFNIIYTTNHPEAIIKYSNSYQYVNHLIKDNTSFREVKKSKLEKKELKIPIIKIKNKKLIFYKYKELKKFET